MKHGPRVIIKDDRDSSIGRGCVLYAGHFRPEIALMFYWAAKTAPHGVEKIVVSEGSRSIREKRDLHKELRAIDLSLNIFPKDIFPSGMNREVAGNEWAERLGDELGDDYQVVVHGKGLNLHIHVELDP